MPRRRSAVKITTRSGSAAEELICRLWHSVEKHSLPSPKLAMRFSGEDVEFELSFADERCAALVLEGIDGESEIHYSNVRSSHRRGSRPSPRGTT